MKTSNWLLTGLGVVLLSSTVATDYILKDSYSKLNLKDPFKNYQTVPIRPFKVLQISGGNGFAIEVKQAASFDMKVMKSRRGFLQTSERNDTLFIVFTVPGNTHSRMPGDLPKGLLISCPRAGSFSFSGISTIFRNWQSDSLQIIQAENAVISFTDVRINRLLLKGSQHAYFDFASGNRADRLSFSLENSAAISMNNILVKEVHSDMKGEAKVVLSAEVVKQLLSEP